MWFLSSFPPDTHQRRDRQQFAGFQVEPGACEHAVVDDLDDKRVQLGVEVVMLVSIHRHFWASLRLLYFSIEGHFPLLPIGMPTLR